MAIDRNTQVVGVAPRISADQFVQVLRDAGSPAAGAAQAMYAAIQAQGVDPAFLLGCFWEESHYATDPASVVVRYQNFNMGNCRTSRIGVTATVTDTKKGVYVRYPDWPTGAKDAAFRLVDKAYNYARAGATTIGEIIEIWAPEKDQNDPAGYTQTVVNLMNEWIGSSSMTPQQFFIQWRGTNGNNYWVGREGESIVAICDHIMQGTMESSDGWFKNKKSQVSAHFGVAKDGRIWQWVDVANRAWANGIPEDPDMSVPFIADAINRKKNPNDFTISIEHEGDTGDPFTEEQYQATLWLHRYLIATYKIVPDRKHIVGHYQISAKSRPNCPGSAFPWARLMADLANQPGGNVMPFNPNPGNRFNVGQGIYDKAAELGLTLISNEQWFTPDANQPGLGKLSRAYAQDASKKTFMIMASEQPELAQPGRDTPWKVEEFQFIR